MPLNPREFEARGPDEPHFAMLVNEAGQRMAIPPGASLWLVEDKARQDKIYPLTLKKVSVKKLVFEMAGMEYTYVLQSGKPRSRDALQRLVKNRADLTTMVR